MITLRVKKNIMFILYFLILITLTGCMSGIGSRSVFESNTYNDWKKVENHYLNDWDFTADNSIVPFCSYNCESMSIILKTISYNYQMYAIGPPLIPVIPLIIFDVVDVIFRIDRKPLPLSIEFEIVDADARVDRNQCITLILNTIDNESIIKKQCDDVKFTLRNKPCGYISNEIVPRHSTRWADKPKPEILECERRIYRFNFDNIDAGKIKEMELIFENPIVDSEQDQYECDIPPLKLKPVKHTAYAPLISLD